ncbi:5'-nucleotidase C-terminal domain-containing protein [Paenibacillus ehimensis]|uniref:5'-nucleotidase C-terminal domain-containing protein n=1 Tax=Paenibacillus ehimensis TaxID=79264 RepID=A0ABT8V5G0_9BACL|nr:5'-nucleotidase C-terminal domain-containing protein [Paenibacillus ehimensis]MDO3676664.1 5'-nucleotidase C-terminal domain-containing protein [Paenibacillus ehimensis]
MKGWKKWMSPALAALMLVSAAAPAAAAETSAADAGGKKGTTKITLFHTNDTHSRVDESKEGIGFAKMAALIKEYAKTNPNSLVLDAGDTFHGQTIANLVRGESIVNIMNAAGYNAMAAGNHDFNYGYERLVELAGKAKFPVLSANTKKADGTRILNPYVIKEVDGIKLGIFGLTTPETAYKTHPNNVAGLTFTDPAVEAKAIVGELKGKVDAIIALTHLGVDKSSIDTSIKVAEQVPDIDVIIDGHSHTKLDTGMMVGNVLIAQTGEYLKQFGRVDLTFENGKLKDKVSSLITKKAADEDKTPGDPAVLEIIHSVKKEQEKVLQQKVGSTSVKLVGDREVVRKGESNLGNLIADAMIDETGADVAITNGGGIRDSIAAGPITKGQVITVLPFGNYIQTKKVKGSDIVAALEHGVSAYPDPLGGFPQVGGITFELDPAQPKGQRVSGVKVKGQPIDPDKMYLLATNDFMAAGGDDYKMFKDYPLAGDYSSLEESLIKYFQKKGEVNPQVEGRIAVKKASGTVTPPAPPAPTPPAPAPAVPAPTTPAPAPEAAKPAPAAPAATDGAVYIVKSGDTLWKIGNKHNTTWQKLQELNQFNDPNLIFPGQKVKLPAAG